ncbi:hypothetical protein D3C85_1766250 [compost metagenome]
MGSQYLPSLANVAKALARWSGATPMAPSRLPSWCMLIRALSKPLWSPTASTIFWMLQKSSWAAVAKVAVLMEL